MELILVLFVFFCGLFMALFPEHVWELQHMFTVRGGEPTDFYLITTRIGGGIFMFMAIVCGGILLFA